MPIYQRFTDMKAMILLLIYHLRKRFDTTILNAL